MKGGKGYQFINRASTELAGFYLTICDTLKYFELLVTFSTLVLVNRHKTFSFNQQLINVHPFENFIFGQALIDALVKSLSFPRRRESRKG